MISVTHKRSVKLNIPYFIEEYYGAYKSGDYEDCEELREHFTNTYNRMNDATREGVRNFISGYLEKNKIRDSKDLGDLFKGLQIEV